MSSTAAEEVRVHTPTSELALFVHDGEHETVLLLHGGPGVPDYLEPVACLLAPGRRAARFDQRGVGRSVALNGSYGIGDYLADVDAIRNYLGVERIHLFGHSWGGLLAQLYAGAYPDRTASLFLCNSSTGVGEDWKRMEAAVMAYNRRQAGALGWLGMGLLSSVSRVPGAAGRWAAQGLMARVWRNYFPDPAAAPVANPNWLAGVSAEAVNRTRKAILDVRPAALPSPVNPEFPVLVLFGGSDIYGAEAATLFARFPSAKHVRLERSGHLPWLQDRQAFGQTLEEFYGSIA